MSSSSRTCSEWEVDIVILTIRRPNNFELCNFLTPASLNILLNISVSRFSAHIFLRQSINSFTWHKMIPQCSARYAVRVWGLEKCPSTSYSLNCLLKLLFRHISLPSFCSRYSKISFATVHTYHCFWNKKLKPSPHMLQRSSLWISITPRSTENSRNINR
jgi:hypothetical protein